MRQREPLSDAGAVVALLVSTGRATRRRFDLALEASGLRMRQVAALRELESGPSSQQALAEALRMDPTKLVGLLNDLESDGLVVRRRDASDRRRHNVEATAAGIATLGAAMRLVEDFERSVVAGIGDSRLRTVRTALTTIAETLDASPDCAPDDDAPTPDRATAGVRG